MVGLNTFPLITIIFKINLQNFCWILTPWPRSVDNFQLTDWDEVLYSSLDNVYGHCH